MRAGSVFVLSTAVAAVIAFLFLGWPGSPPPNPEIVQDVVLERDVAAAAIGESSWRTDVPRTPGAAVLALPWLLINDNLEDWAVFASVVSLGLIAAGVARMVRLSVLAAVVLAVGLPATIAFLQAIVHGVTFLPVAACLVWAWSLCDEHPEWAGVLVGVGAVARLWPLLVVAAFWYSRRLVAAAGFTFAGLMAAGLTLPGVTLSNSVAGLVSGGDTWMAAPHNGSLASWLPFDGMLALVIGGIVAGCVWLIGLRRLDAQGRFGWSVAWGILASPLAWLPYLLTLAPAVGLRHPAVWLAAGVQLVGWRWVGQAGATTLTCLLVAFAYQRALPVRTPADTRAEPTRSRGR